MSIASSLLKALSILHSLVNSTAAFNKFPLAALYFPSNLSNKAKASATEPAKPAITFPSPSVLTFLAVALNTVFPKVTCPSPTITVCPSFFIPTIVVPLNSIIIPPFIIFYKYFHKFFKTYSGSFC